MVLLISDPAWTSVMEVWMSADECRSFVNGLGEAILAVSKPAGVIV